MKTVTFANGDTMPIFGLGTWKAEPGDVYKAVKEALKVGYRHIDCAPIYGNEAEVGKALKESMDEGIVSREDVWITSKLWNNSHAPEDVEPALKQTLSDLQIEYLDLYLIHWPILLKKGVLYQKTVSDLQPLADIPVATTWKAMEQLVTKGLCNHLGVSNFSVKKLENLLESANQPPEMNQVELHPYLQQPKMLEFCQKNNIHLTAYSPLGSADRPARLKQDNEPVLLEDKVITDIAGKHNVTPAQVLISWAIHRNTVVIPKSAQASRIMQNIEATKVQLTEEDMVAIGTLDRHRRYVNGTFWCPEGSPYTIDNLWDE